VIESAEEFVRLRSSENQAEYHRAAHDELPEDVCVDVIERFPDMRFWVAQNKTVPISVLRLLAADPDRRVRSMVARKRKLDEALLNQLSHDSDETVRHAVARHPKCPADILRRLAIADPWEEVRATASRRIADIEAR
jgi:hypothetical protein